MKIKDSETEFDGWSELHVFAVIQINGNVNWSSILVKPQVLVKETTLLGITLLAGVIIIPRYTFHLRPIPQVRIIGDRKITAIRLPLRITQA